MPQQRIVLSLDAERDLDSLFDWIAHDSGVERAEAILRRIDETLDLIADVPRIGRVRYDLDGEPRTFSVWPWIIVYEPQSTGQGMVVWRIIDGRRDLPRHIRG
jgi:toxin ParE1/3/4